MTCQAVATRVGLGHQSLLGHRPSSVAIGTPLSRRRQSLSCGMLAGALARRDVGGAHCAERPGKYLRPIVGQSVDNLPDNWSATVFSRPGRRHCL